MSSEEHWGLREDVRSVGGGGGRGTREGPVGKEGGGARPGGGSRFLLPARAWEISSGGGRWLENGVAGDILWG